MMFEGHIHDPGIGSRMAKRLADIQAWIRTSLEAIRRLCRSAPPRCPRASVTADPLLPPSNPQPLKGKESGKYEQIKREDDSKWDALRSAVK